MNQTNIHLLPHVSTHSLASKGLSLSLACPPIPLLRLQTHLHPLPVYWCLAWKAKDKAFIGQILYARKISFEAMIMIGSQMSSAFQQSWWLNMQAIFKTVIKEQF